MRLAYHGLLTCFALLLVFASIPPYSYASVVLNELMFSIVEPDTAVAPPDSSENHQWLELYNAGVDTTDISGWTIAARAGTSLVTLPTWQIPPDCYLVVPQTKITSVDLQVLFHRKIRIKAVYLRHYADAHARKACARRYVALNQHDLPLIGLREPEA